MFAILETGSKQYKVAEGDVLEVELLNKGNISEDNTVRFESVLLVQDNDLHVGQPFVKNANITAKILEEFKAPKVLIFKKKSKKQYRRTRGHRQQLHRIQIEKIEMSAKKTQAKPKTKPKAEPAETGKAENEDKKEKE
jgi:large subunit ribosomal protein L21